MMICVDYTECEPETYKGVYLYGCDDEKSKSYAGDPVKDMDKVLKYIKKTYSGETFMFSSSVDNFLMDSKKYTYKYRGENVIGITTL